MSVARSGRPPLGQRSWGQFALGPQMVLPAGHSLLVVGPTQAGKTSSLVIPAIVRWPGPVVVTSVKSDVRRATLDWRSSLGRVVTLEPALDDGATWDPLEAVRTHRDAMGVARDLVVGDRSRASAESEFWNALAVKLLGALIVTTRRAGGDIYDLVADVEERRYLDVVPRGEDPVARTLRAMAQHEARTADAVATTVEAMLVPWQLRQPLARVSHIVEGNDTLYLVAPRHEQRRYEGLFRGALRSVLAAQQACHDAGDARELLLVLDEAAAVAPLEDLDQIAATGRGLSITLLSVVQDFAQIEARWGDRAATIVNNHATRLVLGGLLDARLSTYLPELSALGDSPAPLRSWPPGSAALISGRRPVVRTRLVAWWRRAGLRRRVGGDKRVGTMHGWSRSIPRTPAGR